MVTHQWKQTQLEKRRYTAVKAKTHDKASSLNYGRDRQRRTNTQNLQSDRVVVEDRRD